MFGRTRTGPLYGGATSHGSVLHIGVQIGRSVSDSIETNFCSDVYSNGQRLADGFMQQWVNALHIPLRQNSCRLKFLEKIKFEISNEKI